jgi:hypothetical protein
MSPAQLAEMHGHKLTPAGESPGVTLGFGLLNGLPKLDSRKQL